MIAAGRKHNKIIAVGTQQRSSSHFQKAVEIVQSGKLGKVFWVQTWNFENISPTGLGRYPDGEAPSHVDYDRWLGPAPQHAFNPNRFHLLFRWYFDYAGGMMSDWGVHLNDIVLWALKAKGPESVYATGGVVTSDDDRDTPDTLQVVYEFPETTLTYSMRKGNGLKFNGHDYGILFCGTDGSLMLDRSGYEVIPDKTVLPYGIKLVHGDRPLRKIDLEASKVKGVNGQDAHVRNFLDCLASRAKPTTDIQTAHYSTNTCHLGNIAYKLGRKLNWDVETETFKNDPEANNHLARAAQGVRAADRLTAGRAAEFQPAGEGRGSRPPLTSSYRERLMSHAVGPILRILGLLVELFGLAVLTLSGRNDGADVGARLGIATNAIWAIVIVGFGLWATGTVLIYARRFAPSRKHEAAPDRDES